MSQKNGPNFLVEVLVSGGVVQDVRVPAGITVKIIDYDDADGPDLDENGTPCHIAIWTQE